MPASSATRPAGNLPAELTSFVGRRREVTDIKQMLSESRLVTVVGVGGSGKTRLSLRVAASLKRAFPDGVWFVELASLGDPELLTQTVTAALGLRDRTARGSLPVLAEYLRDKQLLVVLDNCEHLRTACATLIETLLRTAPGLRILATSRQVLGSNGEHTFQVPTMSVPDPEHMPPLKSLSQYEALNLFVDRAAAVQPHFVLTEDNYATVVQICQQLDGIPLAIELTAVRLRVLSLHDILERLQDRYRLLTTGSPGALPRHQTLRALVDWSHDLCSEQERTLWARLSVFSGSFDLHAAEKICSGDGINESAVLDLVAQLVDKSIVTAEEYAGRARYRLLETIRQYGHDRLREAKAETTLQRRHRDYFAQVVQHAWSEWIGPDQEWWFARLQLEHSNFRSALESSYGADGRPESGLRIAGGLWFFWIATGLASEGRWWLDRGLQLESRPSTSRAKALWVDSYLCLIQEDPAEAKPKIAECQDEAAQLDDPIAWSWAIQVSGMASMFDGDLAGALVELEESLRKHRAGKELAGILDNHFYLVLLVTLLGNPHRAGQLCEEALALCDTYQERWLKSYLLWGLSLVAWQLGDVQRANASVRDGLQLARVFHEQWAIGFSIEMLAWTAHADRQDERAARLLGEADSIWKRIGAPLFGMNHLINYHDQYMAGVREALGDTTFHVEFEQGCQLSLDEAIADALEEQGAVPHAQGTTDVGHLLTPREYQVAELIAQGLSNKEIATRLVISTRTAEAHVEHIMDKLGFSSRAHVAAWFVERQSA